MNGNEDDNRRFAAQCRGEGKTFIFTLVHSRDFPDMIAAGVAGDAFAHLLSKGFYHWCTASDAERRKGEETGCAICENAVTPTTVAAAVFITPALPVEELQGQCGMTAVLCPSCAKLDLNSVQAKLFVSLEANLGLAGRTVERN